MKRRELSDDVMEAIDATPSEVVELLGKFNAGEYFEQSFPTHNPQDTTPMTRYVERLKQEGLDIGKGDSQFGYKMPLPEKDSNIRHLQIFRRK